MITWFRSGTLLAFAIAFGLGSMQVLAQEDAKEAALTTDGPTLNDEPKYSGIRRVVAPPLDDIGYFVNNRFNTGSFVMQGGYQVVATWVSETPPGSRAHPVIKHGTLEFKGEDETGHWWAYGDGDDGDELIWFLPKARNRRVFVQVPGNKRPQLYGKPNAMAPVASTGPALPKV
ncbi:hypothetical protein [Paludisphaera mucosa]|uniref:Uncharacterized protein n=1 Tax=Paludisphaera mucosa TaxID=3030827 RepID=A0ABT6FAI1_9BACT|nr:hypothetical protein [Paludisphaera mucosa]MDG3004566.1 hypothetical protein [Paludisphaera mucosa]